MIYDSSNSCKYMIFVDEAGDHNLEKWDKHFPVFVLACCIIEKSHYCDFVLPSVNKLKLKYFNRTDVILHEHDIHKQTGCFSCLVDKITQDCFMTDINNLIANTQFTIISAIINKPKLIGKYKYPNNPYNIATKMCFERLSHFLVENHEKKPAVVTFEARGRKEDENLKESFAKYAQEEGFDINIIPKANNCVGLQFADLVARPIGRHFLNSDQPNRAFDIIKNKFRTDSNGKFIGRGLKIFP